jgi:transcriptional regulator of acetoin/glycerol metabolism
MNSTPLSLVSILLVMEAFSEQRQAGSSLTAAGADVSSANSLEAAWPGNRRELTAELARAILFEDANDLTFEHLPQAPLAQEAAPLPGTRDWLNPDFVFPAEGFSIETAMQRLLDLTELVTYGSVGSVGRKPGPYPAPNPAIAPRFQVGSEWRRVGDPGRSTD